ncbi:MAG: NAD(+)/NADH kinase [Kiritimatiellae bacterium]|nr:NAD(+)/NADH kinase [Kiritimatiellia bacterium]
MKTRPTLAIAANETLPAAPAALRAVRAAARRLGIALAPEAEARRADALLVLGGDGSMLRAAHRHAALGKPFLAVNAGSLGYLSSAPLDGAEELLRAWRDGECERVGRSMLRAQVRRGGNGPAGPAHLALNDLVALRSDTGRVVALDLSVDGNDVASFRCDGLILATPTGSTAYSLSAGGPILAPGASAFVVSVVCPHTLAARPLVLPAESVVTVRVARAEAPVGFSADGALRARLRPGDTFTATTAALAITLLSLPGADPFRPLREKLGWSGAALR